MDDPQREDTGDDFQAVVGDVGQPAASPLEYRLTRRHAVRLAGTLGAVALALLVILASVPAVRERVAGLIPTPTPTLAPGADLFYLLPNPPGTTVLLDGRSLAQLPVPGDPHPLRLARGHHHLEWRNAAFPFPPLQCTIAVPLRFAANPCPFLSALSLPAGVVPVGSQGAHASVITLHDSLAALPSDQASSLYYTILETQATLNARQSSAIVQPGEHYFAFGVGGQLNVVTATQPLHAMLTFAIQVSVQTGGATEPCVLDPQIRPCRFPGQDCTQLCTWTEPLQPAGAAPEWIAAALAFPSWEYTTLDGRVIVANQFENGSNTDLLLLRMTWDGTHWHVSPIIGHTPNLPPADDLLCGPALEWLVQGPLVFALDPATARDVTLQEASAATPEDSCAVRVAGPSLHLPTPALFLERFGVLLAANDAAHMVWPDLPRADAAEQALAQQLAAQLTS
jgi:hypothetical protein